MNAKSLDILLYISLLNISPLNISPLNILIYYLISRFFEDFTFEDLAFEDFTFENFLKISPLIISLSVDYNFNDTDSHIYRDTLQLELRGFELDIRIAREQEVTFEH